MRIILVNIFLLLSVLSVSAQGEEEIFEFADVMPEFPGGEKELVKFIESHTCYPAKELSEGIQGTVYIQFIIDTTGKVIQPIIKKGCSRPLDSIALLAFKNMPLWKPGIYNGKKIKIKYVMPVRFKIKGTPEKPEVTPQPCKVVVRRKK